MSAVRHRCRTARGHAWDVEPVGLMFEPRPDLTEPQVSTCQECGTVRTYDPDTGRISYRVEHGDRP